LSNGTTRPERKTPRLASGVTEDAKTRVGALGEYRTGTSPSHIQKFCPDATGGVAIAGEPAMYSAAQAPAETGVGKKKQAWVITLVV
jgi:hypothetical protein